MMKSEAAMEYLMTYGWAILVIAVVLAALYSLGIFNPSTFAPKASAGSCEVVRPFGPGTTTDISLEGTCTNMLPKYVASFNGGNSYSYIPDLSNPTGSSLSYSVWFYLNKIPDNNAGIIYANNSTQSYYDTPLSLFPNGNCNLQVYLHNSSDVTFSKDSSLCLDSHKWYQVTAFVNQFSHEYGLYIDGNLGFTGTFEGKLSKADGFYIGLFYPQGAYFPGYIANVQIYNTALSANQISALYQEGIGGDPINPNHLVAWYPLNGNANDYSGNDYNGKAVNVGYSSTWYRTYSAP